MAAPRPTRPAGFVPARCGKCRRQIVRLVPEGTEHDPAHRCLDCREFIPANASPATGPHAGAPSLFHLPNGDAR